MKAKTVFPITFTSTFVFFMLMNLIHVCKAKRQLRTGSKAKVGHAYNQEVRITFSFLRHY